MHAKPHSAVFTVRHDAWDRVEPVEPSPPGVVLRRLQGGDSESWWLDLEAGGRLASRGLPAEGLITVLAGKARCAMFGNELDLHANSFALLPPNTPFTLRAAGRKPAQVLAHFNRCLTETLSLED
jgi:hypothetical protein